MEFTYVYKKYDINLQDIKYMILYFIPFDQLHYCVCSLIREHYQYLQ